MVEPTTMGVQTRTVGRDGKTSKNDGHGDRTKTVQPHAELLGVLGHGVVFARFTGMLWYWCEP